MSKKYSALAAALVALVSSPAPTATGEGRSGTFSNPLLPGGPDPWIVQDGATYYYLNSLGNRIDIWKTRDITDLAHAVRKTVWTPPASGLNSISIWAPELHRIDGRWYLYYTAAERGHDDDDHRGIFVLENQSADPTMGAWVERGRLNTRYHGIDGTTFAYDGKRYFVYSPYVGPDSDLAIAPMTNPYTLGTPEVIIARPDRDWERQGGRQILEGPEFLLGPRGDLFLTYSASACWSDDYALGLLSAKPHSDPLDPGAWAKTPRPVLATSVRTNVYATGHNGFFMSPDGKEHWIVYHGNTGPGQKCTPARAPRIQKFKFDAEGRPVFGEPQLGPLHKPSGTPR
jgi:GH43 family beta-xylosidase